MLLVVSNAFTDSDHDDALIYMLQAPPKYEVEHFAKFFNDYHPHCLDSLVNVINIKDFMTKLARLKAEAYTTEIYDKHVVPKFEHVGMFV